MIYCYRHPGTGEVLERNFPIGKAPEVIETDDGVTCARDFQSEGAGPSAQVAAAMKYPYVSSRLPHNLEGCPADSKGKPVILSQRHEREVMSRHGYIRD